VSDEDVMKAMDEVIAVNPNGILESRLGAELTASRTGPEQDVTAPSGSQEATGASHECSEAASQPSQKADKEQCDSGSHGSGS
jgi:hypothetical protein